MVLNGYHADKYFQAFHQVSYRPIFWGIVP